MSSFGRTIGLGAPSAALLAVACAKPWFSSENSPAAGAVARVGADTVDSPLASALSLVVLAGWGAVLVTSGRLRKSLLALTGLAALGVLACCLWAPFTAQDRLRSQLDVAHVSVSTSAWFVVAAIATVLTLIAVGSGWPGVAGWPSMSRRYDAPSEAVVVAEPSSPLEMWKALDDGVDPTAAGDPRDL